MLIVVLLLLLVSPSANGQQWLSPMPDYPMILSANFAEARPSHLHSGIDIKTGGAEGRKVVAVRDGYVSRIGVKPYGYGRVLYITHDDGSMSVYAHLNRFVGVLEQYLKKKRYETATNDVDLFPEKNLFRFNAGEQIAYSGNSGSSGGPHLHFEIRRAKDQSPINILSEGIYDVRDDIRPTIAALHLFAVDTLDGVRMEKKVASYTPVSLGGGHYRLQAPVKMPCKGYFAVEVTDRKNDTQNTMGVYSVQLLADGQPRFGFCFDDFSFAETRYVNSMTVYSMQRKSRNEIFRLLRQKGNYFSGLEESRETGVIDPTLTDSVSIRVFDDADNLSVLSFAVKYDSSAETPEFSRADNSVKVLSGTAGTLTSGDFSVQFKASSLFEDCFMAVDIVDAPKALPIHSLIYRFADENTPFFTNATVSIRLDTISSGLVIARYNPENGKLASMGGQLSGKTVSVSTSTGGCFCVALDTIPPKITPMLPKGFSWAASKSVSFKMADEFSGVASYSMQIDGKFAILEHNMKRAILIHNFDDVRFGKGKQHKLVLTIKDGAGNRTVYTKTYTR